MFTSKSDIFASVFQVFLQVFQMHVLSVSYVVRRMLQRLHQDVSSPSLLSTASPQCLLLLQALAGHPLSSPPLLDASDVQDGASPGGCVERRMKETAGMSVRTPVRLDVFASKPVKEKQILGRLEKQV
jgi:hypothetical protein